MFSSAARAGLVSDSIEKAMASHPTIHVKKATAVAADQEAKVAKSDFYPVVNVSTSAGRVNVNDFTTRARTTDGGSAQSWMAEGSFSLRQLLFDGDGTQNKLKAAEGRKDAADYDIVDSIETISMQAAQAHLNVMRTRELLGISQAHYKSAQNYRDNIEYKVSQGAVDEAELFQAEDVLIDMQAKMFDFETMMDAAEAEYNEVVGSFPDVDLSIDVSRLKNKLPKNVDIALEQGVLSHPGLKSLAYQSKAYENDIQAEKSEIVPRVDAELSYLEKDQDDDLGGELVNGQALVRMSWNFSTGGAYFASVEKTRQKREAALGSQNERQREIEREIRTQFSQYVTSGKKLRLSLNKENTTEKMVQNFETQFEGGEYSLLQLLSAQNRLFEARVNRINGFYRYQLSKFSVLNSMGSLRLAMGIDSKTML